MGVLSYKMLYTYGKCILPYTTSRLYFHYAAWPSGEQGLINVNVVSYALFMACLYRAGDF